MTTKQMEQWLNQRGTVSVQRHGSIFVAHLSTGKQEYDGTGHTREDAIEMLYNWVSKLEK